MAARNDPNPETRHLLINPFGPATLVGSGIRTDNANVTLNPIGTLGMNYMIRVNQNGAFDIEIRDGSTIVIDIECHGQFVTQYHITLLHQVFIHNNVRMVDHTISTRYFTRAFNRRVSNFRLTLTQSQVVRRLDTRYNAQSWLTTIIIQGQILYSAVDGAATCQLLQDLLITVATRGRRSGQLNEPLSFDFGLSQEHLSRANRLQQARAQRRQQLTPNPNAPQPQLEQNPNTPQPQLEQNPNVSPPRIEQDSNVQNNEVREPAASTSTRPPAPVPRETRAIEVRVDTTLDDDNYSGVTSMATNVQRIALGRHPWNTEEWEEHRERDQEMARAIDVHWGDQLPPPVEKSVHGDSGNSSNSN